jgi:hypothetical protein
VEHDIIRDLIAQTSYFLRYLYRSMTSRRY